MQRSAEPGENTTDKRKTRNSSKSERRNSVSDIKDFFTTKMAGNAKSNKTPLTKSKENKNKAITPTGKNAKTKGDNTNESDNQSKSWEKEMASNEEINQTVTFNHDNDNQEIQREEPLTQNNNSELPAKEMASKETQTTEDIILSELRAMKLKLNNLESDISDPRKGLAPQLAKTNLRVDNLYSDIHGAVNGLEVRMQKTKSEMEDHESRLGKMEGNYTRLSKLLDENKQLMQELQVMQGLVQKVNKQTINTSHQVLNLTKRGMEQNLIVQGISDEIEVEDPKRNPPMFAVRERCKNAALLFFKEQMNLDLNVEDIWKAHRTGMRRPGKVRPMVIKMSYAAKDLVMENLSALKGKKNLQTQQTFFISEQIPEGISENRKQIQERLKVLKDNNEQKGTKDKIQVINDKILINDRIDSLEIMTPQPSELFVDTKTQISINGLQTKMVETEPVTERNSEFIAVALKVHSLEEIKQAYIGVMQRYPAVDHTMLAYAFKDKGTLKCGGCDDREFGASTRIKKTIFEERARNTAVFVLRNFGGVHLGFDRFRVIQQVTRDALKLLEENQ